MPNYLEAEPSADVNSAFVALSPFNEDQAAELEAKRPGHLMALAEALSAGVDSRLKKNFGVPFVKPYPLKVKMWVADLLTPRAFRSLGIRPTDEQQQDITDAAKLANDEIKEAADAKDNLFELPSFQGGAASLQENDATLCYSEQSPFTSKHRQFDLVKDNPRLG
jgi:hypothetical protein